MSTGILQWPPTETAVLWVKTVILRAFDNREITCLVLLDLSVAFDTICHETLLSHLKFRFGLGGTILKCFQSYLSGCTQWVVIDSEDGKNIQLGQLSTN